MRRRRAENRVFWVQIQDFGIQIFRSDPPLGWGGGVRNIPPIRFGNRKFTPRMLYVQTEKVKEI